MSDRQLSWDYVWIATAATIARRSGCVRTQVGAVIVDPTNRLIASGYNGPPATLASARVLGEDAICEYDCPRAMADAPVSSYDECIAIHAEANALLFCDRRDREGGTIYVTRVPCLSCAKLIANSGLERVVVMDFEEEHLSYADRSQLFRQCGITMERFDH